MEDSKKETPRKVILIVEDDPAMYRALADALGRQGFSIIQAHDGISGLASALFERPDAIVLDILLPGMDGFQMLKKLRMENEWGKHVPVVILTVLDPSREDINKSIAESPPTYYLEKTTLNLEDLQEKITSITEGV
jgi:DNA-binding response OmpR family regulator